jgi:hypothetical protein
VAGPQERRSSEGLLIGPSEEEEVLLFRPPFRRKSTPVSKKIAAPESEPRDYLTVGRAARRRPLAAGSAPGSEPTWETERGAGVKKTTAAKPA